MVYLQTAQKIRNFDFGVFNLNISFQAKIAGLMFALFPIPFIETVYSLAICNRLIYVSLITWLYSCKNLRGWPLLFILCCPSLIFYSSLALRDTLIMAFMVTSTIFFIERRYALTSVFLIFLCLIKPQNGMLLSAFFAFHTLFMTGNNLQKKTLVFLPIATFALYLFSEQIIYRLNYYREYMFLENGNQLVNYIPIVTLGDAIKFGLNSSVNFFMMPLPWMAENLFQKIQSLENIFIMFVVSFFFLSAAKIDKKLALKWGLFLFFCMSVYSLVVFNYGTAARYKFPFVAVFTVGLAYDYFLKTKSFIDKFMPTRL
jgi:hypothetical protein